MKKLVILISSIVFSLVFLTIPVKAADSYPDLGQVEWAKEEILYLSKQGIISGYPDGTFKPNVEVTRGQVALMVVRDLYPNATPQQSNPFKDVSKGKYYTNAVRVAYEKGIINGYPDQIFKPNAYITRAEVAVIVDRAYSLNREGNPSGFPDGNKFPWAKDSILDLNSKGIINGYPDGTFKPGNDITRAAFAKVLGATINPAFRGTTTPARVKASFDGLHRQYTLRVFAENEETYVNDMPWAGANEGDIIHEGYYEMSLQLEGSKPVKQRVPIGDFSYNESQENIYILNSNPDVLVATEVESSNVACGQLFFAKNGEIHRIGVMDTDNNWFCFSPDGIKHMKDNTFQTIIYNNATWSFFIDNWTIDFNTGAATNTETYELGGKNGHKVFDRFMQEPDYVYTP
ncbi:S-layer homology domain-containing protein [Halobacillus yeomjeoni]|uniref:S-layer homology domain-containing protein n=1 Tax=Halobacillus yeomjeoni TaxID=311194 RepID=A0A931MTY1_9BACI|nr:S-layer homology domain-containing protein [Halobacillus yeomjeoni]MBH0228824.1 S-layer homology domain-containing protein [Halobacillus yeomjeoni]